MHSYDEATEALSRSVIKYALERVRMDPPLDGPLAPADLEAAVGATITPTGLGGEEALRLWTEVLAPACISQDHPRALSFVPSAPTEASVLFDLVVGASAIYGGSWMEGAGAVTVENQALRWIADLAGLPAGAGGCFVSGGSAGNLSALVAARHAAATTRGSEGRGTEGRDRPHRWVVACSAEVHSSVASAAQVMDIDVLDVPTDARGRMSGEAIAAAIAAAPTEVRDGLFAVVATSGTTNAGIVDDLAGAADAAEAHHLWLHIDGAYGGAALAAPSARGLFAGVERADSIVVDPHKWLFAPFDCAALVYRDPSLARAAHTQKAAYLDVLTDSDEWNPSDYAYHLSRRARGLPFWFSLATHGTDAYAAAVETVLRVTREGAAMIDALPHTELVMEPELSVILYRRVGWRPADYKAWSDRVLAEGLTLSVPTSWRGETLMRACLVNPRTTTDDLRLIVDSMT